MGAQLVAHMAVFAFVLFSFLSPVNMWNAIKCSVLACILYVVRVHGWPQLNMQYFIPVFMDESVVCTMGSSLFLMGSPNLLVAGPLLAVNGLQSARVLQSQLPSVLPSVWSTYGGRISQFAERGYELYEFCAKAELMLALLLVVQLFTRSGAFLLLFSFLQYIRLRYFVSPAMKAAFANLRAMTDRYLLNVPGYSWVVSMLSKLVDVEQMQRQQQAQRNCVVM